MQNSINIYGITDSIAYCEAQGLAKCFAEYSEHFAGEYINCIGFNSNSGYVYIALENGIQICSMMGNDIEYLITDFETGEETFFSSYAEAEKFM